MTKRKPSKKSQQTTDRKPTRAPASPRRPTPPQTAGGPKPETVMRSLRETREAVRVLRTDTRGELAGIADDLRRIRERLDRLESVVDVGSGRELVPIDDQGPSEADHATDDQATGVLGLGQP